MNATRKQFKTGDLVLVRFHPALGQELKKYRPAIIATSNTQALDNRFTTIIPLTTKLSPQNKFEITINHSALNQPSLALCWYLLTIDAARIVNRLGTISPKDKQRITQTITALFR